jgi:hypothetical protein
MLRAMSGRAWLNHLLPGTSTLCPLSGVDPLSTLAPVIPRRSFSLLKPGRNPKPKRRPLPLARSSK